MRQQNGFSLVMAIFILVILSLLGGYMVKLSGVQHATTVNVIQSSRAYQAAKAGSSWAMARISSGGDCSHIAAASPLSFTDIIGFSVSLGCISSAVYTEGTDSYIVYKVTALSEYGAYNSTSYISRKVDVSVVY
ncbi:MAG: hypothetical protein KAH20_02965 [Methylococcales bacterium]|nr:hypothetical protein [Methylococcales bacterium]